GRRGAGRGVHGRRARAQVRSARGLTRRRRRLDRAQAQDGRAAPGTGTRGEAGQGREDRRGAGVRQPRPPRARRARAGAGRARSGRPSRHAHETLTNAAGQRRPATAGGPRMSRYAAALKYAVALCATGVTLLTTTNALADVVIEAEPLHDKKMRIDGLLREWPGRFASFKTTLKGSLKASGLVGYDDKDLYVAIKAADDKIVRTRAAGDDEDHATLSLAFPNAAGRYTAYEVALYPGDPGKLPGVVKVNGRV